MASFTAGTTFVDGVANDVTAAKLGALVTNATPTSGFIQDRTAETIIATNDTLLFGDASDSNTLKRITVANFAQTLPTAKVTTGTIDTGTFGTTTSTAATITNLNSTTGTVATLNSTTGTITNLSATTSTFLGTITGSTNVVNIGSGQIYKDASGNVGIGTVPTSVTGIGNPVFGANNLVMYNAGNIGIALTTDSSLTRTQQIGFGAAGINTFDAGFKWDTSSRALQFSTSNTERLRIDSSGNVGIGSTSPGAKLDVTGNIRLSAGSANIEFNNGGPMVYSSAANTLAIATGGGIATPTERLRIDSSGNCSIGTATALSKLHVHGDLTLSNATTSSTGAPGGVAKAATYAGFLTVSINGTSRKIPYYA